jgi:hypothetical protein
MEQLIFSTPSRDGVNGENQFTYTGIMADIQEIKNRIISAFVPQQLKRQ